MIDFTNCEIHKTNINMLTKIIILFYNEYTREEIEISMVS